jgi:hypothetical protein
MVGFNRNNFGRGSRYDLIRYAALLSVVTAPLRME